MKTVFSTLRGSLFEANQNFNFANPYFTFMLNSATSVQEQKKVVSSANSTFFNILDTLPLLFRYNKTQKDPEIRPKQSAFYIQFS